MAQAKQAEPKRKFVKGFMSEQLWQDFRIALMKRKWDVTRGLEVAIAEWLAKA